MKNLFSMLFVAATLSACGTVVEPETLTYGEVAYESADERGSVDCSTVLCFAVECPDGFERVYRGPNDCCGTCKAEKPATNPSDEGYCRDVSDCEGLVHIMCVGSWDCADNTCSYTCDSEPVSL